MFRTSNSTIEWMDLISFVAQADTMQCVRRSGGGGGPNSGRGTKRAAVPSRPIRGGGDGWRALRREVLRVCAVGRERGMGGDALGLLEDVGAAGQLRSELGGDGRHAGLHVESADVRHGAGALLQGHIRGETQAQALGAAVGGARAGDRGRHERHVRVGGGRRAVVQHLEDQGSSAGASAIVAALLRRCGEPLQSFPTVEASRTLDLGSNVQP